MLVFSVAVLLCTAVSRLGAAPRVSVCNNELIENDSTNYFATSDCTRYKHCYSGVNGRPMGEIMSCSFPTYWNQALLTCTAREQVNCLTDYCLTISDGTRRPGAGSCRGYWECVVGRSVPRCCSYGQRFDNVTNTCVITQPDSLETCDQRCFTDKPTDLTDQTTTISSIPPVCNRRAVAGNPGVYVEYLPDNNMAEMPCPPGTVFSAVDCNCIDDGLMFQASRIPCQPELLLTFDTDTSDESPRPIFVRADDVSVRNGAAIFNGYNSSLVLQRFSNLEHKPTVIIRMTYNSDHNRLIGAQSLVSNDNCAPFKPSINIREDRNNVYFSIGTIDADGAVTDTEIVIPQTGSNEKTIEFSFTDGVLTASLNGRAKAVKAPGYLQNVPCGLNIGTSRQASHFNGSIDFLRIHLCVPGTFL